MKKFIFSTLLALASTTIMACGDNSSGFLPENDLRIPVDQKRAGGLSEEQFNEVIDKVGGIYAPIMSRMGATLRVDRLWENERVNASAMPEGRFRVVKMYGGLARHEAVTQDGFALVLCHELGHHIGGAPRPNGLSNEGQSDYWASLKCLRRVFLNDDNALVIRNMSVPAALMQACSVAHPNKIDRNICIRTGMAGVSVAKLFSSTRNQPEARFDTPDRRVVNTTVNTHPPYQCRLDTFLQGSICEANMNEDVSFKEEVTGTCHGRLGHRTGLRPTCWFKPSIK